MMVRVEADFSFCGLLQNIERFCVDSASSNTQIESKVLWGDGARARRGARALERAPGPTAAAAAAAAQEAAEPAASPAQLAVCGVFVTERGLGIDTTPTRPPPPSPSRLAERMTGA